MNGSNFAGWLLCGVVCVAVYLLYDYRTAYSHQIQGASMVTIKTYQDIIPLFAKSVEEITTKTPAVIAQAQKIIDAIIAVPGEKRTFANTMKQYDILVSISDLAVWRSTLSILEMTHPDKAIRDAAHQALIDMNNFVVDAISANKALYQAIKTYAQTNAHKEKLSDEQRYFIKETVEGYERDGLGLPDAELDKVKALQKEIAELCLQYSANIAQDTNTITVKKEELAGLSDDFINALKKSEDGNYILGHDYPTRAEVMQNCAVTETRKKMYHLCNNIAYHANKQILQDIIAKRDQLAHILGFSSYAALDLANEMVKTPERAHMFLDQMAQKLQPKVEQELALLLKDLPESVTITAQGTINPWDLAYIKERYKEQHFTLDEREIAQYFPMEKTVKGLLDIYAQFFGLRFKELAVSGLWHEEVSMLQINDATNDTLIGYILLDLYPRDNKYNHAANCDIIPVTYDAQGSPNVGATFVVANFPKSTTDKPSLLKRADVVTFFHEFGHALHVLLGRTRLAAQAGTAVKRDFVELPSQMLEEWLEDKEILKQLSSHYKTGQPLPDDVIEKIIKLKQFDSGLMLNRQLLFANLSLAYFGPGAQKDVGAILYDLSESILSYLTWYPENHMYTSFGHLTGYGARYYGYLWSKVFALDIFAQIKKEGLLNPAAGKRYQAAVIGKGGSKDPNELLVDFLGREPNQEAFLQDMGL